MGNQQNERESEENAQKETTRQLHKAYADAHAIYMSHAFDEEKQNFFPYLFRF